MAERFDLFESYWHSYFVQHRQKWTCDFAHIWSDIGTRFEADPAYRTWHSVNACHRAMLNKLANP